MIRDEFVLTNDYATLHTTLEDALSHRTGLPKHDYAYGFENETSASIVRRMRYLPMTAEPRTKWQYCNVMYTAVSRCLEILSSMSLEEVLKTLLWTPLGMASTTFNISATTDLARGYFWDPAQNRHVAERYVDLIPLAGAGATISTVEDYALWMKALLSAYSGNQNDSSPISPAIFRDLMTPRSFPEKRPEYVDSGSFITPPVYSLGWLSVRAEDLDEVVVMHNGGLTGFGTTVYLVPEKGIGIVMMANTANTSNSAETAIASWLLRTMLRGEESHGTATQESVQAALQVEIETQSPLRQEPLGIENLSRLPPFQYEHQSQSFPVSRSGLDSITGAYSHPAYGSFNLTIATPQDTSASNTTLTFQAYLYPRTWPARLIFTHLTNTLFRLDVYKPHGLGDKGGIESDNVVFEKLPGNARAVFEFDLLVKHIVRVGLELEEKMVAAAATKHKNGGRENLTSWGESMIWFKKQ